MRAAGANGRRAIVIALAVVAAAAAGGYFWWRSEQPVRAARAAFASEQWQRAFVAASTYLKRHPNRTEVRRIAAQSAARLTMWSAAEDHFSKLPATSPDDLRWRISAALGLEHWSRAAELLEQMLEQTPDDTQAMLKLAGIRYKDGHDVEATELADRAAALSANTPHAATAYSMLGQVHTARGNRTVAIEYLRKALKLDPDGTTLFKPAYELRLELVRNLLFIGDPQAATAELEILEKTGPRSGQATVRFLLGRASWCEGELETAEQHWQRAIDLDAGHADSLAALGELELNRKNADAAIRYLEAAIQHDPKNVTAFYLLSRALVLAGDADAGHLAQQQAVRLRDDAMRSMLEDRMVVNHPDSPETKAILATREAARGNWSQAEQWAREAARIEPANPRWQRLIGQIRARQVPEAMVVQ